MTKEEMDHEANYFAMCLLLPKDLVLKEVKQLDLCDDDGLKRISRKFGVSLTLMVLRLRDLGVI